MHASFTSALSNAHIQSNCKLNNVHWPQNKHKWPEPNLGTILGCGSLTAQPAIAPQGNPAQPPKNNHTQGASRLLRILISESAYLIWVLRCKRVIQERHHGENEIKARWLRAINARLTNDKITATRIKHEKGFTNLVVNTWEHVLGKTGDLPNDWLRNREVLVGRR